MAVHFSNLTKFGCSSKRDRVSYTYDIFHKNAKDLIMQNENFRSIKWHDITSFDIAKNNADYFWTRVYQSSLHLYTVIESTLDISGL